MIDGMTELERKQVLFLSVDDSKGVYKLVQHYTLESFLRQNYTQTDWFGAWNDSSEELNALRNKVEGILQDFNDDLYVVYSRNKIVKTTKQIFLKYIADFINPSLGNALVVSIDFKWVLDYHKTEVMDIWIRK